jgi:glutamate N-acetyltransferase/amino-acid N-acetyltransferase
MAVGISAPESLAVVEGIRVAAVRAGIRYPNRRDLVLFELAEGSSVASVFTRNKFCAAPVLLCRQHLQESDPRYLLINTGFANAGNGAEGLADAHACCEQVARLCGGQASQVLPFSTGVIGGRIPLEKVFDALPSLYEALSPDGWVDAAHGIMTTDTVAKGVSSEVVLSGGKRVTLTGIAKGSGMIRPDMATMLAFIATDAVVDQAVLQKIFAEAVKRSFNRITVDGDTSTNDSAVLVATCKANHAPLQSDSEDYVRFVQALESLCQRLAQSIIRDGEGATKFISVVVEGAALEAHAEAVAMTIAHSPLIKTAFFASDPNWGRILAAVGRAPVDSLQIERVSLYLGDVCLIQKGEPCADYTEEAGKRVMNQDEITIRVDLGQGACHATVWTCDFSYEYVRINADYRS